MVEYSYEELTIEEFFSNQVKDKEKWAILAGAGISIPPPSSIFSSYEMISEIIDIISPTNDVKAELLKLLDPKRDERLTEGDFLRFELIMDIIQRTIDPELRILDFLAGQYDEFFSPNETHLIISKFIQSGIKVITTNFDCLIESAAFIGGNPISAIAYDEEFVAFMKDPHNGILSRVPFLFKLHGSLEHHGRQAKDSIIASLRAVGSSGNKFEYQEGKRRFLKWVLKEFNIIVVGYSGYDDFDISPLFEQTKSSKKLIWVNHNPNQPLLKVGESITFKEDQFEDGTVKRRFINILYNVMGGGKALRDLRKMRAFENVMLAETDTLIFLKEFYKFLFQCNWPNEDSLHALLAISMCNPQKDDKINKSYFKKWAETINLEDSDRYYICGLLFNRLDRISKSLELLKEAENRFQNHKNYQRAHCARMLGDIYIELNNFEESLNCYQLAKDIFSKINAEYESLEIDQFIGYVKFLIGGVLYGGQAQRESYEKAKKAEFKDGLCIAPLLLRRSYFKMGLYDEAENLLRDTIALARVNCDLRTLVQAYIEYSGHQLLKANNLSTEYKTCTNDFRKYEIFLNIRTYHKISVAYAVKASYISRKFGFILKDADARFNLASGLLGLYDYVGAEIYYNQALRIFKHLNDQYKIKLTQDALETLSGYFKKKINKFGANLMLQHIISKPATGEEEFALLSEHEELSEFFPKPENFLEWWKKLDEDVHKKYYNAGMELASKTLDFSTQK
jgi:tetratricopeptide (TPR) repeat protein